MPASFDFSVSPFDCLSLEEQRLVRDHVDVGYWREGATLLAPGEEPAHLFVVIKGAVHQFDGDERVATYGPDDCFDGRAFVTGRASSRFVAHEEVLAHLVARDAVRELVARNATFAALLFADLSQKLAALAERSHAQERQSLSVGRVEEAFLRPAHVVDADDDIVSVVRVFQSRRTGNVLVHDARSDPPRTGVFTTTGLQRAVLEGTPLAQLPVRAFASFDLVTVRPQDALVDALALMIRHQVQRVVVVDGERVTGFLEHLDLLGFLSNPSSLISMQVAQAEDVAALARCAAQVTRLIALLWRGGAKPGAIARLVGELNAKLFERAWRLVAPADLVANSCLFVMGSEGRGEQLLKTDQDNGLVLRDGYEPPHDLEATCRRFSEALAAFGYPECPGGIMVSNPQWRQPARAFGETVRRWLLMPDAESLMALAIFLDAQPVCGDASLLAQVRGEVDRLLADDDVLIARFAAAIDAFEHESGWWVRLLGLGESDDAIDLKKAGIFPLVHGVRSMALEARLACTGTVERIHALCEMGRLPRELGAELVDSLHFLMGLKLQAGLDALAAGGGSTGNGRVVHLTSLSSLQRGLLKDALAAVKRFQALLRHRYRLDML
ncbi:cyclic nucleotide-binding domain-containing protein [Ramlibacter sp. USB13]|uniref:Cyclic nucleotide-binding domain-containing protein n=1 Tax=Ramlibacter cellulosilyticus TaxID=2764187 RepID=A0A923S9B7_9BURK|nr:cyclic nucleotide-binding domain-containing protein [Ramlibacter cellulosilyticus]